MAAPRTPHICRGLDPSSIIKDFNSGRGPRRGSRATTVSAALFDAKYHPMDRVLRPNAAATLKYRARGHKAEDEVQGCGRSGPASATPSEHSMTTTPDGLRRSGRWKPLGKRPLYDTSRHLMDDALSSSQSSNKRKKQRAASGGPVSEPESEILETVEVSHVDGEACEDDDNNLTKAFWPAWHLLEALDQQLYAMQQGLPDAPAVLPLTWRHVSDKLMKNGHFTREQCRKWGGEEMLRKQYAMLRKHIQSKAGGKEPRTKTGWTVRWAEGWDVYDLKPGGVYEDKRDLPKIKGLSAHGKLVLLDGPSEDVEEGTTIDVEEGSTIDVEGSTINLEEGGTIYGGESSPGWAELDLTQCLTSESESSSSSFDEDEARQRSHQRQRPAAGAHIGRGTSHTNLSVSERDLDGLPQVQVVIRSNNAGTPAADPSTESARGSPDLFVAEEQPVDVQHAHSASVTDDLDAEQLPPLLADREYGVPGGLSMRPPVGASNASQAELAGVARSALSMSDPGLDCGMDAAPLADGQLSTASLAFLSAHAVLDSANAENSALGPDEPSQTQEVPPTPAAENSQSDVEGTPKRRTEVAASSSPVLTPRRTQATRASTDVNSNPNMSARLWRRLTRKEQFDIHTDETSSSQGHSRPARSFAPNSQEDKENEQAPAEEEVREDEADAAAREEVHDMLDIVSPMGFDDGT